MFVFSDLGNKSTDLLNANSEDRVICVSAVVFKPVKYKQFRRAWESMLQRWDAPAFHATDFYNGGGDFKRDTPERQRLFDEDSRRIPKMVGGKCEKVTLLALKPKEYIAAAPPGWFAAFGDSIHSIAMQTILIAHGWWREKQCPSQKFAYFMESGDPDESKVLETVSNMRNGSATSKVIGVKSFTSVDKGEARGLEAADFWAWHWNKYQVDRVMQGKAQQPRKDFEVAVGATKNGTVEEYFLTGDKLQYFFSRVPDDVLKKGSA